MVVISTITIKAHQSYQFEFNCHKIIYESDFELITLPCGDNKMEYMLWKAFSISYAAVLLTWDYFVLQLNHSTMWIMKLTPLPLFK